MVFLDTNIRKLFIFHFSPQLKSYNKTSGSKNSCTVDDKKLLTIAERVLYKKNPRTWHYALMDYGAAMLAKEKGLLERVKSYHTQSRFEGSTRYWRSQIIKYLLQYKQASGEELQALVSGAVRYNSKETVPVAIQPLLSSLTRDGLVEASSPGLYRISQ